jgi:two-component system, chemotaxis family, chemotaxis protein CheY
VRDEVAGFLKGKGLEVATAIDGKDGLAKVKADTNIRLIVADVNMPNMDGLTMAEKIRGELANKTVNIIMLTTETSTAMKDRGKAAGVKGWIVKPFNGEAVIETFKRLAV